MKLHFFIVLLLIITSCSKYSFTDITETDLAGNKFGNVDNSDWKINDSWSSKEKDLFETEYQYCFDLSQTRSGIIDIDQDYVIAFPNPARDVVNVNFSMEDFDGIEIVLVDHDFNIVSSVNQSKSSGFQFLNLISGDYYRIYYKIIKDNCAYSGHGDILVL